MMAKAHIAVGMAAAVTIMKPDSIPEMLPVITGASLGCLLCDLDCDVSSERKDSSHWRIVMATVAVAALIEDHLLGAGMWKALAETGTHMWFFGMAGFAAVCMFASISGHRGFSHSLLALAIETLCLWMLFPMTAAPFAIAFLSHLVLGLTNKRSVRLLYPLKKGFCLNWFYADRLANRVFTVAGSIWLIAAFLINLRRW